METAKTIGLYFSSVFIIFGGGIAYIPQSIQLLSKGGNKGFSPLTCLILLLSNTSRLFFWYGERFELQLLAQSVFMCGVMLLVMWLCVRRGRGVQREERRIWGRGAYQYFWRWTSYRDYLAFLAGLVALLSLLTYLLASDTYYTGLGYVALLTESCMGLPQLTQNWRAKSTQGMSVSMVVLWAVGDVYKTTYFFLRDTPIQFMLCGGTQVAVDLLILMQVLCYRESNDVIIRS